MNLIKGLVLGNLSILLAGMLQGAPKAALAAGTGWFTTSVLALASLALFWGEALEWKRKCWPHLPGLEMTGRITEDKGEYGKITENNGNALASVIGSSAEVSPLIVRSRLVETLNAMVRNHYDNRSVSRASMVATGQCSQPYWNLAQAVLVRVGFRQEGQPSAWTGQGSAIEDLKCLAARVIIGDTEVRVRTERGEEVIDLTACHFL